MNQSAPHKSSLGAALALSLAGLAGTAQAATLQTWTQATPGDYEFVVPAGVSSVTITAVGAKGGNGCASPAAGGKGASISGSLEVTPSSTLYVRVAGPGSDAGNCTGIRGVAPGGYGGGGDSGIPDSFLSSSGGGGASSVATVADWTGSRALPLIVAAGGGGSSYKAAAGGDAGQAGVTMSNDGTCTGGEPGTQTAGGAGGISGPHTLKYAQAGSYGQGGRGVGNQDGTFGYYSGAGGGGGYYGGGGAGTGGLTVNYHQDGVCGGGGGSSYIDPSATDVSGPTVTSSPASVSISYLLPDAVDYDAQIQPPINADGGSSFNAKRGVIPVKFAFLENDAPACAYLPATIQVIRDPSGAGTAVDESVFNGPADSGSSFRISDCQYVYNLNSKSLGAGQYRVNLLIDGDGVGTATFALK